MRILIAGAGSVGTVVGVLLANYHDVVLLRRSAVISGMADLQISITGVIKVDNVVKRTSIETVGDEFDAIIFTCQSQDTLTLAQALIGKVSDGIILVSFQNGLQNPDTLRSVFPKNPIIIGSVWWGATLLSETQVHYRSIGDTFIGIPSVDRQKSNSLQALENFYTTFEGLPLSHFNCSKFERIEDKLYEKLVFNVLAPASALMKDFETFLQNQEMRTLTHYLLDEAIAIVTAFGVDLKTERLLNMHKYLNSQVETPSTNQKTNPKGSFKTSTQISTEKYGGRGSNVEFLLGELEQMADKYRLSHHYISLVKSEIQNLSPNYVPVIKERIIELIESGSVPECILKDI